MASQGSAKPRGRKPAVDHRADTAQIVQGLRRIVKALHGYSQEVRAAYGLTGPQLWALNALQRGPATVGQLAVALAVHQSSISILLDRLERRGLVRRLRREPDRRVVAVELTRRGAVLAADAPEPAQGRLLHALARMPHQEVRKVRRVVDRLVHAMEAEDVKARFFFAEG
ncbi:MAG TPA: MarR family winged helix-turn-helix transcriptional regulator [Gemmatimonadales bacterium]|nr:MarR family winged helix-turn-helix transcriptional regulator [Gemmatimonadales bacterium]